MSVQKGVRRRARRRAAAVAGALAVVVVAVGPVALDGGRGGGPEPAVTAGAVQVLRADTPVGGNSVRYWSTLRGVLPKVTYTYDSAGRQLREQVTDSVVVGRVVRTEPARGMLGEPLVVTEVTAPAMSAGWLEVAA